jgi:sortase (surface protein transpeptidase)
MPRVGSSVGSRRPYAVAAAAAVAGAACIVVAAMQQQTAPSVPLSTTNQAASASARAVSPAPSLRATTVAEPTEIAIPAIKVRSSLLQLGQAADGSLAVPPPGPHYDQAGWYRYSPKPGAVGPAVIVGHIDSKSGGPSVFFHLGDLKPRDTIDVTRADGSVAVFAVDDVRRFHKTDFPTQLVYGNTDHAALRLITCGGPFDRSTGHYLDNIVVTASLLRAG